MNAGTPIGTVLAYAGDADSSSTVLDLAMAGWLICDGSKYKASASRYHALFNIIGYSHGGDADDFCVPNYKGYFLRGVDSDVAPNDPNAKDRTPPRPELVHKGNSGGLVGSIQQDLIQAHSHKNSVFKETHKADHVAAHNTLNNQGRSSGHTGASGNKETRPTNLYVHFIIKFANDEAEIPLGVIIPYGGEENSAEANISQGWLPCDGRLLTADIFSDLYDTIEDHFGGTDTEFALPDLRGVFIRGVQGTLIPGITVPTDPDSSSRKSPRPDLAKNGNNENRVGSFQVHDFASHLHSYPVDQEYQWTAATLIGFKGAAQDEGSTSYNTDSNAGSSESRPKNINVNYIIKSLATEPPPNHIYQPGEGSCCFCSFGSETGQSTDENVTTMMRIAPGCDLMQFVLINPDNGETIPTTDMSFTLVKPDGTEIASADSSSTDGIICLDNCILVTKPQAGMWLMDLKPKPSVPYWFFGLCVPQKDIKNPGEAMTKLMQAVMANPAAKRTVDVLNIVFGTTNSSADTGLAIVAAKSEFACFTCSFSLFALASLAVIATIPEDALLAPAIIVVWGLGITVTGGQVSIWLKGLKGLTVKQATKTLCKLIDLC